MCLLMIINWDIPLNIRIQILAYYISMNKQEENFSKLSKYKEFLASNNCPENLPDYDQ